MKVQTFLKPALIGLVCLGMTAPQTASGDILPSPKPIKAKTAVSKIPDIVLTQDGTFRGVIVDGKAGPVVGERVVIRQGRRVVTETETDKLGEFRTPKFRAGTYQVTAGKVTRQVRVWTENSAPKSARKVALLVTDQAVMRGQGVIPLNFDPVTAINLGIAGTGLGFAIHNSQEINDLENHVDRLAATTSTP